MKVNLRSLFNFDKIVKIIQRNWYIGTCIAILLLSFWLRWSGVDWQLPDMTNGDEEAVIQMTHSISFGGDLVIRGKLGFWYCPAYNYLTGVVFETFDRVVVGVGLFPSHKLIPVWTHYIVGRTISILLSVGTIFVLLFMFKNVFGKFIVLLAGLFLALNGVDIHVSAIAKSDTMAMFLGTLTLYLAFKIMTTKKWTLYLIAGVVYGVAVASKLFTLGFFVPLVVAHLLAQTGDNLFSRLRNAVKDWRWLILPVAALGGYAISNPQVITAAGTFLKEVPAKLIFGYMSGSNREFKTVSELLHQMKGIYSNILGPTYSHGLKSYSSSLLALALTFIGSVVLLIRQFKLGLMMLVTFISVNLFILPATAAYGSPYHYLVIIPICALLIGSAIDALWSSAIRIRLPLFRFLLCGIITIAMVLAVPGMLDKAIRVPTTKTGEGILSRHTDFRKWMIDHIPPGSRIAYDRYGTDLLPGYFDVVKKPGYDKGLDYYSKNFDYVIVSWDRIDDYKVYQELIKRQPMAIFKAEGARYMPRLAIYKMDRDESKHARMRNFYTESLPRKMGMGSTFNDPSFENGDLLESWGVRLFHPYRAWKHIEWWKWEEINKPAWKAIKWWDGKNNPPHSLIERASDIWSDGKFSLHIMLAEEKPNEKVNLLSKGDSTFETECHWIWAGRHSASREADGNSYKGQYALKVVSSGPSREWNGISLTHPLFNYNSGKPNKLIFYAKSVSGSRRLQVRSGDGTWATFTLSNDYRRYEIVGSTKIEDNILLILEGAGIFYLDSVEFGPFSEDKRIQVGQVIPYDLLDWLQYFSIDYYLQCDPAQDKPPGSIKLHFIAESIGGQYLNIETHVLYDSSKGQNPTCNKWHTFNRNIKADFNKPFVRWKDIEFMIFFVEVENSEFGSLDIYIDNIQTVETLALRKFLNDPDRNR